MIVEFAIENFRSVAELQTLSFVAAKLQSKNETLADNNVIEASHDLRLLRSAGIYGANGSGKSNLVRGLMAMNYIVMNSMRDDKILRRLLSPFQLNPSKQGQPTWFQLQFVLNQKKFRYGFEATQEKIVSEWLFGPAEKNETMYFNRAGQEVRINKKYFKEGEDLDLRTSETNLFLNVAHAFNGPVAREVKSYFDNKIKHVAGVSDNHLRNKTLRHLDTEPGKQEVLRLMNLADAGMETIRQEKEGEGDNPWDTSVYASRKMYDSAGEDQGLHEFDIDLYESEGTKKLFDLSGSLIDALREGYFFNIDEFDARMHPLLSRKIIEMFNNPELNRKGAQLLFVTHDTNLLDKDLLRRDQIYFTEKDRQGRTNVYSLYDFKGVRNDAAFEKNYLLGKYGAVPFLGDFNRLFDVE